MKTTILPVGKRAEIHNVWVTNTVFCKRYVGKFKNTSLVSKAETGLWYCRISGNPHNIEGEGTTPELAVKDSIIRNLDMVRKLRDANRNLEAALASMTGDAT